MKYKLLSKRIFAVIITLVMIFQCFVASGITINEIKGAPPTGTVKAFITNALNAVASRPTYSLTSRTGPSSYDCSGFVAAMIKKTYGTSDLIGWTSEGYAWSTSSWINWAKSKNVGDVVYLGDTKYIVKLKDSTNYTAAWETPGSIVIQHPSTSGGYGHASIALGRIDWTYSSASPSGAAGIPEVASYLNSIYWVDLSGYTNCNQSYFPMVVAMTLNTSDNLFRINARSTNTGVGVDNSTTGKNGNASIAVCLEPVLEVNAQFIKYSQNTDGTNRHVCPGAVYAIYNNNNTAQNVARSGNVDTSTSNGYIGQFTTGSSNVSAKFPSTGTYYLAEVSAPNGTVRNKSAITINLQYEGQVFTLTNHLGSQWVPNSIFSNLKVYKRDAVSNMALSGAELSIYEWSNAANNYAYITTLSDPNNDGLYDTIGSYTARDRSITTSGKLYETNDNGGWFKVVETRAPNNYIKDNNTCSYEFDISSTLNSNGQIIPFNPSPVEFKNTAKVDVKVVKTNELGIPMPGVEFNLIYGGSNHLGTTDRNGVIVWQDIPEKTNATLVELTTGNFIEDATYVNYNFNVTKENNSFTQTINITNNRFARIVISKKGSDNNDALIGAKFSILEANGSIATDVNGNKMEGLITGNNGTITTGQLYNRPYKVVEVAAPYGYNRNSTVFDITFEEVNVMQVKDASVEVINNRQTGLISIIKTDKYTNAPVSNATYKVFTKETWEANPVVSSDNYVGTITTDAAGNGSLSVPTGEYYVVESECPVEYVLSSPKLVEVQWDNKLKDNETAQTVVVEEKEERRTFTATVTKIDSSYLGDSTSTDAIHNGTIQNLKNCEFILYSAKDIRDINTGDIIPANTILGHYSPDNLLKMDITEITEGNYAGHKLPYPTEYILEEIKTAEEYALTSNNKLLLNNNPIQEGKNTHVNAEFENVRQTVKLVLTKVDANTHGFVQASKYNTLKGAEYNLYNTTDIVTIEGNTIISAGTWLGTYQTDENGVITVTEMNRDIYDGLKLPNGRYQFNETKASLGYALNSTPIVFYAMWSDTDTSPEITVNGTANEKRQTISINIDKQDAYVGNNVPDIWIGIKDNKWEFVENGDLTHDHDAAGCKSVQHGKFTYIYCKECYISTIDLMDNTVFYFPYTVIGEGNSPYSKIEKLTNLNSIFELYTEEEIVDIDTGTLIPAGTLLGTYGHQDSITQMAVAAYKGHSIPNGKYRVVEIVSSKGYSVNTEPLIIEIGYEQDSNSVSKTFTFSNNRQNVVIDVTKSDINTGLSSIDTEFVSLKGAKYELYNTKPIVDINTHTGIPAETFLGTFITDENGQFTINKIGADADASVAGHKLPNGLYELREVEAPKGYALNSNPITIGVEWNKDKLNAVIEYACTEKETRQNVVINITKVDENTGIFDMGLVGSKFQLIAASDLVDIDTGTLIPVETIVGVYEVNSDGIVRINTMNTLGGLDAAYDGHEIPNGKYSFIEIEAADGYTKSDEVLEIDASPALNEKTLTIIDIFGNTRQTVKLILNKVAAATNEINAPINSYITLERAKYQLVNTSDIIDIYTKDIIPAGTVLGEYLTDKDGHIEITTMNLGDYTGHKLPNGTYQLVEIEAPNGYVLDSTPVAYDASYTSDTEKELIISATVEEKPVYAPLVITKETEDVGFGTQRISGIGFKVYRFISWKDLEPGEIPDEDFEAFKDKINEIQKNIRDWQSASMDEVELLITDNYGHIFGLNDYDAPVRNDNNINSIGYLGEVVIGPNGETELFTDENGQITTIPLPYGEYFIVETAGSEFYYNCHDDCKTEYVFINQNGVPVEKTITNRPVVSSIEIIKIDTETGKEIHDNSAKFIIDSLTYDYHDGKNKFTIVNKKDNVGNDHYNYCVERDAEMMIVSGIYTITEETAPDGYKPLEYLIDFTFTKDGVTAIMNGAELETYFDQNNTLVVFVPNEPIKNNQIKYEIDENGNEQPVVGAKMQLVKVENDTETVIDEWTTDGTPHTYNKFKADDIKNENIKFILREIEAPYSYLKAEDMEYNLTIDGDNIIKMQDKYTTLEFNKLDKTTNETVKANFVIKDKDGNIVREITTTDGPFVITRLLPGTYTISEEVPYGYYAADINNTITIEETADTQKFTLYNDRVMGYLHIIKKGHDDINFVDTNGNAIYDVPLKDVEFTLYYETDFTDINGIEHHKGDVSGVLKTDENGEASLNDIPAFIYENGVCVGEIHYSLKETKTVGHYALMEKGIDDFTFEYHSGLNIKDGKSSKTFDFTNDKPIITVEKHGELETFEGSYEDVNREDITVIKNGDEITYSITINNIGLAPAKNVMVKDILPEYLSFVSNEDIDGVTFKNEDSTLYWVIDEIEVGKYQVLTFTCKVDTELAVDIVNKAYSHMTDNDEPVVPESAEYELETKDVVYTTTVISYTIDKDRITDAPQKGTEDKKYGFRKDEVVTYKITINNLGTADLTMNVADEFENPDYFTDIQYIDVKDATWNNADSSRGTAIAPNITVEGGKTAIIMVAAKVTSNAKQILAMTMYDDKENNEDGYVNTVTTSDVTAKVYDADGNEHIWTKEDTDELKEKTATANTPVQTETDGFDDPPVLGPDETNEKWFKLIVVNFFTMLIISGCVLYLVKTKKKK